jgi:methionyl-tRNA formyltransferase
MGSAELSCCSLVALHELSWAEVVGVVCQPDRPQGRRLELKSCPVKACTADSGVPVLTPQNVNSTRALEQISALRPDAIAVVAYGQILRRALLDVAPMGCVNVHTSLLPAYRGAAPIQWAIANGEQESGVTTMQVNEAMDEGDILLQERVAINDDDTAGRLHDRLATVGAALLVRTLDGLKDGSIVPRPQDQDAATYAPKLSKRDGRLDWSQPALRLRNRIRGFNPWPACSCELPDKPETVLRVLDSRIAAGNAHAAPGDVLGADESGPVIQCGEKALCLTEVQPQGGRRMTGSAYLRGHPLPAGLRLA